LAEAINAIDSIIKIHIKNAFLSEVVSIADLMRRSVAKTFLEVIRVAEMLIKSFSPARVFRVVIQFMSARKEVKLRGSQKNIN